METVKQRVAQMIYGFQKLMRRKMNTCSTDLHFGLSSMTTGMFSQVDGLTQDTFASVWSTLNEFY